MITDEQAGDVIEAVLNLAATMRDEVGPGVTDAAHAVLAATAGDPIAALTVAAALIHVDQPIDRWWQSTDPPPRIDLETLIEGRPLAACGTHSAFNRHRANREPVDTACLLAERVYQRDRKRALRRSKVEAA